MNNEQKKTREITKSRGNGGNRSVKCYNRGNRSIE